MIAKKALSTLRVSRYTVYFAAFFLDNIERSNIDYIGHAKFCCDALQMQTKKPFGNTPCF